MMRTPNHHRRPPFGLNLTPMIDVVFQLIVFFLLSTHLAQQETHLVVDLPEADGGMKAPLESPPRVTLNLLADGTALLGSTPVPRDELVGRLRHERDRVGADVEVRIRADRSVPYEAVEPILLACADAGIWNVTFAVYKRDSH